MRVAEVHGHAGADGGLRTPGHLFPLVPGHAVAKELGEGLHLLRQQVGDPLGVAVAGNTYEHDEPGGALDESGDLRLVPFPDDEVTLPESRNGAVVSLL